MDVHGMKLEKVGPTFSERIVLDKYLRRFPQPAFCWRQIIHFWDFFLSILGRIKKRHISVRVSGKQTVWRNRNPSTVKLTLHKDHNGPARMLKMFGGGFRVVALPSQSCDPCCENWKLLLGSKKEVRNSRTSHILHSLRNRDNDGYLLLLKGVSARLSIRGADHKDGSSWKRMEWSTLNLYMIVSWEVSKQSRQ